MYLRKITEGSGIPANAILDGYSNSQTDAYSCNYINELFAYSSTEKKVGTWINGKPLYRKVITTSENITNGKTIPHNIANVDMIYAEKAFTYNSSGTCYPLPIDLYGSGTTSNTDRLSFYVDRTNIVFKADSNYGGGWAKIIVLEYTKTTDNSTRNIEIEEEMRKNITKSGGDK